MGLTSSLLFSCWAVQAVGDLENTNFCSHFIPFSLTLLQRYGKVELILHPITQNISSIWMEVLASSRIYENKLKIDNIITNSNNSSTPLLLASLYLTHKIRINIRLLFPFSASWVRRKSTDLFYASNSNFHCYRVLSSIHNFLFMLPLTVKEALFKHLQWSQSFKIQDTLKFA